MVRLKGVLIFAWLLGIYIHLGTIEFIPLFSTDFGLKLYSIKIQLEMLIFKYYFL